MEPDPSWAEQAAVKLMAELPSNVNMHSIGTGAVKQSIIAMALPVDRRGKLIAEQLRRAQSPYEGSHNRTDYLHAALNLAADMDDLTAGELFELAIDVALNPSASEPDAHDSLFGHPLGAFRVNKDSADSRAAAALLAARLLMEK